MKVHGRILKRLMYVARYSEDPRCWKKLPMQVTMATLLTEGGSQRKSQSERRHIDSFKISTLQNLAHYPPWSTNSLIYIYLYALCTVYILYIMILNVPLVHWSKRRCFRNEAIFLSTRQMRCACHTSQRTFLRQHKRWGTQGPDAGQLIFCQLMKVCQLSVLLWLRHLDILGQLVGGLEHGFYDFPYIGNFIIPTNEFIFFRGLGSTTNQINRSKRSWSERVKGRGALSGDDLCSETSRYHWGICV